MIIGRKGEIEDLQNKINSNKSEFIAIYGRRRVGKTFLINELFGNRYFLKHTGLANGNKKIEIQHFVNSLKTIGCSINKKITSWLDAFSILENYIKDLNQSEAKIIFLDEISWMDTKKSDFLMALENFWNNFACARKDIKLIICGSATSWILNKIIHNHGGLYNRLTFSIHLSPFNLNECEEYARYLNIYWNRIELIQAYMILGGIPYYWSMLNPSYSLFQNIDYLFIEDGAPLAHEIEYILDSIFKMPDIYKKIIKLLSSNKSGMTRKEIAERLKIPQNGHLSNCLEELTQCDFLRCFNNYKTKNSLSYQLIDNLTLFYNYFLKNTNYDSSLMIHSINTPMYNTWTGLAFEKVCIQHLPQIKNKLGINGILTNCYSFNVKKDENIHGSQIDLVIERADKTITLCEMKFSHNPYTLSLEDLQSLSIKTNDFIKKTKTKKAITWAFITTYGIENKACTSLITSVIKLDDLFKEIDK